MNNDLNNKLNEIKIENFIWVIYLGIIILSWYSNFLEKNYFLYHNLEDKHKYRFILVVIFSILLIVYFYFLKSSWNDYINLKPNDCKKKKNLVILSLLGSLFVFLSGIIFLYIAYEDQNLDVEIAFN